MGLGDLVDKIGDSGEKLLGKAKKKAGELIDDGAHLVGDGLDHVGLHDAADWVDDHGDAVADQLGAEVAEQQLGQTEDPKELLHGDSAKIRAAAEHLARFHTAFETGHSGLIHLDPGSWDGDGAEAFRAKFKPQPAKWAKASAACQDATDALTAYAHTVDWALGQAKEAVRLWKQGQAARKTAADAYNAKVDRYNSDLDAYKKSGDGQPPVKPADFVDPGAKDRATAKDTLDSARRQRDTAAGEAESKIRTAAALAPEKPDFTDRMKSDGGDFLKSAPIQVEHFAGGLVRSGTDLLKFVRGLNPYDPYNLTHPAQYLTHLNSTAAGLVDMTAHPERLPGMLLGSGWGSDGDEAGGRLIGNILMALATDGGSAGAKAGVEGAGKEAGEDAAARAAAEDPLKSGIRKAAKDCVTDPVDIATGDMLLSQTDLSLAGTLPLVLDRTHLSSYRTGRWFGPSWASTLDQRLELDGQGAVFVADDGALLVYPVPAAGSPVLPVEGPRWPLEWDGVPGSPVRITDTDTGRTLHFAAVATASRPRGGPMLLPLAEVSDRNGNNYRITYDAAGVPAGISHSGGYRITVESRDRRVTGLRLVGADGTGTLVRSFGYDSAGRLTEVVNSSGLPYRFTYDTAGRITSWTDRNDSTYRYGYDSLGRCVRTEGPDGFLAGTLGYDGATRTTTFTDSLGNRRTYQHDAAYRLIRETDPLGHTTVQEWDAAHRLVAVTDPLGATTRYGYDDAGRVTAVDQPDGTRVTVAYNALGLPVEATEAGGATWTYGYDERGNRLTATDPLGGVTRSVYGPAGQILSVTDPDGSTRAYVTNAAGLVTGTTDPLGHRTAVERDAFGRVTAVTDQLGHTVRAAWTVEGRPLWRQGADGVRETWTWDPEGNLLARTDRAGRTTRYAYTHFDLAATRTDPDGRVYSFGYDSELNLTRVTGPGGLHWTYAYDPAGLLTSETDFNGRTLGYAHDAAGRLAVRTNGAGQTLAYTRDPLGRITEQRTPAGESTTYAYDADGLLAALSNADAEVTYERDALGHPLRETVNGRTTRYTYDPVGRRTSRTTPGGHTSTWTYDAAGRPAGLETAAGALEFTHDAAGRETGRRIADAFDLDQVWDPAGRLVRQSVAAGPAPRHRDYTYRPDGYLTEIRDSAGARRRFALDPEGRVTAVDAATWTESYAYDPAGNLTRHSAPGADEPGTDHHAGTDAPGTREYSGTRITRAGRTTYEHDAQGRLTRTTRRLLNGQKRVRTYTWDAEDRLTGTHGDGTAWRYRYDPLGRRIAKQQLGLDGSVHAHTDFTWEGTRLAERTAPGGGTTTWDYAPDSHRPLVQTENGTRFYAVVTDPVGTPTELLTAQGETAWRISTPLWGGGPATATAADCPLRFPGQYADDETGLHYNLHRYYDPHTARYLSADPLGLLPADNDYAYVHNPTARTDVLGLADCEKALKVADKVIERAQAGKMRKASNYHPHFPDDQRVLDILKNPDAIYQSQGGAGKLIFRQGDDIVVVKGGGAGGGDVITGYGPSGIKGDSGAKALGGRPEDPGDPITHDDIINGRIKDTNGNYMPPAIQIR
ncbi:putative T7SS-secreted protein [Actinacidiphila paucisporea]|nr:DUF6531 domain-containing protein [Actinacidiphila paucisporea]